jgi:hypothetical protein
LIHRFVNDAVLSTEVTQSKYVRRTAGSGDGCLVLEEQKLIPWSRILLEKLPGFQLVKNFPAFYGIRGFITALTRHKPPVPILSQFDQVQTSTSHLLKIHLNIMLPSTPGTPKWKNITGR